MRFVKKRTIDVALKCDDCKNISTYPLNVFPRYVYKRHGYIRQHCYCVGRGGDTLGNTKHRIVGIFLEQQLPLSTPEARRLLGSLVSGT